MTTMNNEDPADQSVHELAPRMAQTTEGRYHDFTLAEAMEIAKRNDPGARVPSTSRTLIAEIVRLRKALLYTADPMREAIAAEREQQTKRWTCQTHGDAQPNAWGCPECVREMRSELDVLRLLVRELRGRLERAAEKEQPK